MINPPVTLDQLAEMLSDMQQMLADLQQQIEHLIKRSAPYQAKDSNSKLDHFMN